MPRSLRCLNCKENKRSRIFCSVLMSIALYDVSYFFLSESSLFLILLEKKIPRQRKTEPELTKTLPTAIVSDFAKATMPARKRSVAAIEKTVDIIVYFFIIISVF